MKLRPSFIICLFIALLLTCFSACQKSRALNDASTGKIKSALFMANGQATLTTYNYDNLGRFVLSQSTVGITTTYVYSTDSLFETQIDSAIPAYSYTKHFALNSSGQAFKDPAGDIYIPMMRQGT